MHRQLTLGSLFDGSGGFPLGAILHGIKPVWASEIEPFPIRVTTKRFPDMKHYGDISRMDGADIEPVDIITFGSPCTNLSVAGRQEGLNGKQSVLFYEAIRIIKEMRCATNGTYPRFITWENVPGAFSSSKGEDFRAVLESVVQVIEPKATVPAADKNGWPYADILVGDGWSLAYRVLDAQFHGVPQRRKRIYLVADFAGGCAGDILFERQGVSRNFTPGFQAGQGAAGGAENCSGTAVSFEPGAASRLGGHVWEEFTGALRANAGDNQTAVVLENHPADSRMKICEDGIVQTLSGRMGTGGNNVPLVMDDQSQKISSAPAMSIAGNIIDRTEKSGGNGLGVNEEVSFTLNTADRHAVAYSMTTGSYCDISKEQASTLMARDYKDPQAVYKPRYLVRRLTPSECCRLQGFPDGWCARLETPEPTEAEINWWAEVFETHRNIMGTSKKPKSRNQITKWLKNPHTDSAEYKMWGNGVALPCVCFVMAGIAEAADIESSLAITRF